MPGLLSSAKWQLAHALSCHLSVWTLTPPPLHGKISLVKLHITCVLPKLASALAKAACTFGQDHWEAGRMPVFLPSLKITQQILNFLLGRKK